MRLPIILMLAVIVLTPANIRELTLDAAGQVQVAVAHLLERDAAPGALQVAEVR